MVNIDKLNAIYIVHRVVFNGLTYEYFTQRCIIVGIEKRGRKRFYKIKVLLTGVEALEEQSALYHCPQEARDTVELYNEKFAQFRKINTQEEWQQHD